MDITCPKHRAKRDVQYEKWAVEIWSEWRPLNSGMGATWGTLNGMMKATGKDEGHSTFENLDIFHRAKQLWRCNNNKKHQQFV